MESLPGRGSVIGSVIAPIIKVCNNPQTWEHLSDDMDVNAGRVISEGATLDDIADDIMQVIEHVANGQYCAAERLEHQEFVLTYKAFDYSKSAVCRADPR
ncbi:UxaA family hydrolase [Escherichia coli]|nr:UxaA family hydrolase [Escherichia coli]